MDSNTDPAMALGDPAKATTTHCIANARRPTHMQRTSPSRGTAQRTNKASDTIVASPYADIRAPSCTGVNERYLQ